MSLHWTDEEKQIVLEMAGEKLAREIAEELAKRGYPERSAPAVRGVIRRCKRQSPGTRTEERPEAKTVPTKYQQALDDMARLRAHALEKVTDYTEIIGNPQDANIKILSISDAHIPFYHDGVIQEAVSKHSDADVLVLNGDIMELYAVSKWPKNKQVVLKHEYKIAMAWLKKLADIFPKVVLTKGNHEHRLQSYFQSNIDPVVSFMTEPDILQRLANGYDFNKYDELEKTYDLPNVYYRKGLTSWFAQVGKVIFAHPTGGSGIPMRTAINAAGWFEARDYDFECVVIGHTHQMGSIIWNHKLLIEQGCACVPLEYESTSRMGYRPQSYGYAVIYVDEGGHVDFGKSGPVYYGTGCITPNDVLDV
jgi:predicted phosphodiesterase